MYKRICREMEGATLAFELVFGHIISAVVSPVIVAPAEREAEAEAEAAPVVLNEDEDKDVDFGVHYLTGHYNAGIEVEHEAHEKVKQLTKDYIGKSSKILYCY